jgi:hypothetical protein
MAKKVTPSSAPKVPTRTPKNIPGGNKSGEVRGDVPKMRNPPPPPVKKD